MLILDQVADPEGCEWSLYEGPLFIDFRLPVEWSVRDAHAEEPVAPEQVVIDDVSRMATEPVVETLEVSLEATVRMGDAGWDQVHRVVNGRLEGVTVNQAEAARIRACWLATGALNQRLVPGTDAPGF